MICFARSTNNPVFCHLIVTIQIANEIAAAKILAGRSIYITQFLQKKLNLA